MQYFARETIFKRYSNYPFLLQKPERIAMTSFLGRRGIERARGFGRILGIKHMLLIKLHLKGHIANPSPLNFLVFINFSKYKMKHFIYFI